jgi:hypothetical protein
VQSRSCKPTFRSCLSRDRVDRGASAPERGPACHFAQDSKKELARETAAKFILKSGAVCPLILVNRIT